MTLNVTDVRAQSDSILVIQTDYERAMQLAYFSARKERRAAADESDSSDPKRTKTTSTRKKKKQKKTIYKLGFLCYNICVSKKERLLV